MPIIGVEAAAASAAVFFAAAIAFAYLTDSIGVRIRPAVTLVAAAAASVATFRLMHRAGIAHRSAAACVAAIVAATFGWLLWLALPELQQISGGLDLATHLALLSYIEHDSP